MADHDAGDNLVVEQADQNFGCRPFAGERNVAMRIILRPCQATLLPKSDNGVDVDVLDRPEGECGSAGHSAACAVGSS